SRKLPARKWFSISSSTRRCNSASPAQARPTNARRSASESTSTAAARIDSTCCAAGFMVPPPRTGCLLSMRKMKPDRLSKRGKNLPPARPSAAVELAVQPGAGVNPVALGGCRRDAQRLGGLRQRQAGEVAQLDQLCLERVFALEFPQGFVQ